MSESVIVVMGQINPIVGDIPGNTQMILDACKTAINDHQADIIVFPELAITGYPPEDILLRDDFYEFCSDALTTIKAASDDIMIIVGHPTKEDDKILNSASIFHQGKLNAIYHKRRLPNYGVFDEERYFEPGTESCIFEYKEIKFGLTICEDLWHPPVMKKTADAGAEIIISINASPFDIRKRHARIDVLQERVKESPLPIIYVHCYGGQDEVIFDGGSMVLGADGEMRQRAPFFEHSLMPVTVSRKTGVVDVEPQEVKMFPKKTLIYDSLVLATHDYAIKNGFSKVILGLSGGIDSALAVAIAVDALGPENVSALIMPSRYTSQLSIDDALKIADNLKISHHIISIEPTYTSFLETLKPFMDDTEEGITQQNLQARCRGMILMAFSNKFHQLVLTTGNKSEMAMGYSTLYGDSAGGFAVLKDIPKSLVYDLVDYRNTINRVIPESVVERPPSAELAENQTDQDTLPPYDTLDSILERYVENDESIEQIKKAGFNEETIKDVIQSVERNEYKRRQAPPGPKTTKRAFGRDRRYPITSRYASTLCNKDNNKK